MENDIVTVGTKTNTNGQVLTGQAGFKVNGQDVSIIGDTASCNCGSKSCRKTGPIIQNSPRNIAFNGVMLAKQGDLVDTGCGLCFILPSEHKVSLGTQMASNIRIFDGVKFGDNVRINHFAPKNANLNSFNDITSTVVDKINIQENEQWLPVAGDYPILIYETKNKMDDFDAPDMLFGDENKSDIERYGLMKPFKGTAYHSYREGYTLYEEDQFSLPTTIHFKRMRSLGDIFSSLAFGKIMDFDTSGIFNEMVDKFQQNEGGYYINPILTKALKNHETTTKFHNTLKECLIINLKNGVLPSNITDISSAYMKSSKGASLPKFDSDISGRDLYNGTVLTVHDIWSMRIFAEELEYRGSQIRGSFKYEIQDHFGLDVNDINHDLTDGLKQYEWLRGFRSWYLLQHFAGYGFKPFITQMDFTKYD